MLGIGSIYYDMSPIIVSVLCVIFYGSTLSLQKSLHQQELFMNLTDDKIYEVNLPPGLYDEEPVLVNVSMYFYNLASMDDRRTEYSVQLLLRLYWKDSRLAFEEAGNISSIIEGDHWHSERIWQPTLHVPNNKELGAINKVGKGVVMVQIQPDGTVLLSKKSRLTLMCFMNFKRYPMDKQVCSVELESSTLQEKQLQLQWHSDNGNEAVVLSDDFYFSGFHLTNYSVEKKSTEYMKTAGKFSKLVVNFNLQREFTLYLIEIYIPSTLIVIVSWTSFWIDIPGAPARVSLGITTMLTLVTSVKTARDQLPRFAYVNALDIWIVGCIGFIFASLIEYSAVNFIYYKDKNRRSKSFKEAQRRRRAGLKRNGSISSRGSAASSESVFTITDGISRREFKRQNGVIERFNSVEESTSVPSTPSTIGPSSPNYLIPPLNYRNMIPPSPRIVVTPDEGNVQEQNSSKIPHLKISMHLANSIDRKCRYIFPICFIIFNISYWSVMNS